MEEESPTGLTVREDLTRTRARVLGLPGSSSGDVRIQWALVDGGLVHVNNVPDGAAGRCLCLVCERRLIARRGRKASWHFAHEKGAPECPLHSEPVLKRFLATMHLKELLDGVEELDIVVTCRSRRAEKAQHINASHTWIAGWDEVRVGGAAHELLVLKHGKPMAAINVRGSTPIGTEREEALRQMGVPWT